MQIETLELSNFRNYDSLHMDLDSGTNILYGDNAQGKTNILESIYLCATTKSHRGSKDREIIHFDRDESHIRMLVRKHDMSYRIDMHLKKNKSKGIAINGIPIKKASELFGIINIVFFSPEDLNIIKNGPSERRRFVDSELCQLDKLYLTDLMNYNRILNQRNKLLKDISFYPDLADTMDVWDEQLLDYGLRIIKSRRRFIEELNDTIIDIHKNLTGEKEILNLIYEPNTEEDVFSAELKKSRDKDFKFRQTSVGPHRDDLGVKINDIDIRKYGSQGQQRTAALSLKLSEIYLVKKIIRDTPILLLDDVLSELDSSRQNYLLKNIHNIQTLITCTGLDEFVSNQFKINKVFKVMDGNVFKNN
ncbi:DNA replication/repair protein RecF [Ruminococcus sp. OA3]|uniref:DNA replication/repair protein RecF n=1 Tax=Ruminococcus sp. OA3 TaxID=2914164 RepID=UPI001F051B3D|nr:DNA replication/repair protein RecF [Ruminococcus sp. OA3]MCH1981580.1 DNA replication/repair protein RecF [Ruminococcus sp. OA3]